MGSVLSVLCVVPVLGIVMIVPAFFIPLVTLISRLVWMSQPLTAEHSVATGPTEPFAER